VLYAGSRSETLLRRRAGIAADRVVPDGAETPDEAENLNMDGQEVFIPAKYSKTLQEAERILPPHRELLDYVFKKK